MLLLRMLVSSVLRQLRTLQVSSQRQLLHRRGKNSIARCMGRLSLGIVCSFVSATPLDVHTHEGCAHELGEDGDLRESAKQGFAPIHAEKPRHSTRRAEAHS